jgi:hypothetical protein
LLALAVVAGGLHLAMAPNETAEEGSADPFLFARGPVLRALAAVGVVDRQSVDPCLPSVSLAGTTYRCLPTGEKEPVCAQEVRREPVYRGLLLNVGRRVTYRLQYFGEWRQRWWTARLCYVVGDRRFVAAENGTPDPHLVEVSGFVPSSARGHWVEYSDDRGGIHALNSWGDIDPFWSD